jgi:hypothetical protein
MTWHEYVDWIAFENLEAQAGNKGGDDNVNKTRHSGHKKISEKNIGTPNVTIHDFIGALGVSRK